MIYVTLEAATPKLAEKPNSIAGRKFSKDVGYNQVNNLLKKRDVEIDNGAGSVPINRSPDKENTSENTDSKIDVNKVNDDMNESYGNYNSSPSSTSSTGTHHSYPSDRRPGGRY
ncbi:hypothetical protein FRX31_020210 [Thalictrum thalictroides]|uniref:Uncharacterized protein n=1 Tax=Thalictrum thalictroides TaxID=46969 RepID=A0A7J6VZ97_THATH|nr:hypothetical protein FRX31_020210 [Thalictrum thalictroides]